MLNWWVAFLATAGLALAVLLTSFRINPVGYLAVIALAATYGLIGWRNLVSHRRNRRIFVTLMAIAQMTSFLAVLTSISYIATAANFPLVDDQLLAWDRALGFDFGAYVRFINDREWLIAILSTAYRAIGWPILIVVAILPVLGYYRRTAEFVTAFAVALIITTCVSTIMPAIGAYKALNLGPADYPNIVPQGYYDTLYNLPLLRNGTLRTLNLSQLVGVLTFPSFHAATATLYIWAFWPIRWLRPFTLFGNGAMIVATPVGGGHYLVDVLAGTGVAMASIYLAWRLGHPPQRATAQGLAAVCGFCAGQAQEDDDSRVIVSPLKPARAALEHQGRQLQTR
jgi:hypothetical protein